MSHRWGVGRRFGCCMRHRRQTAAKRHKNGVILDDVARPMRFTGYLDESDTHGRSPDIVMSAILSTEGKWARCGRGLKRAQDRYGFTIFHATDFKNERGEFAGWSGNKMYDLLMEFGMLGFHHFTETFTVSLSHDVYRTGFLDRKPNKMHRTSQYGICFMGVLDAMMRDVMARGRQHDLSVVVEKGHPNGPDTGRLFAERKKLLEEAGVRLLDSHKLATKLEDPLLQFADVTAHGHAMERREIKSGATPHFSEREEPQHAGPDPGWTVLEVTAEYLERVIEEYTTGKIAAHAGHLRRKQERQDAKVASGAEE